MTQNDENESVCRSEHKNVLKRKTLRMPSMIKKPFKNTKWDIAEGLLFFTLVNLWKENLLIQRPQFI